MVFSHLNLFEGLVHFHLLELILIPIHRAQESNRLEKNLPS